MVVGCSVEGLGRGGAGSGSLVSGKDSHRLEDSSDLNLGSSVDDIPLVHVSVTAGSLDSVEEVRGGKSRNDVLGEHLCKRICEIKQRTWLLLGMT
jgi:hypothetical protein